MIKLNNYEMPTHCFKCKMTHIDECGDYLICGITNKIIHSFEDEVEFKRHDSCPLEEVDDELFR